jgi:YVTN family beta-propeller protein
MKTHATNCIDHRMRKEVCGKLKRRILSCACFCFLSFGAIAAAAQEPAKTDADKNAPTKSVGGPAASQKIVEQGIAIEFTIDPLQDKSQQLKAGEDAVIRFKVTDTTTGTPVKGLGLSVWLSRREADKALDAKECREKIQSFLGGSLRARPDVDLNAYYILSLNKSPDISVLDPLLGFGGSRLLTLIMLKSPGEDWLLTGDGERLFVTLPAINQVAVVDTRKWVVRDYLDTGVKPMRIVLQPDQKYLWVANDGNGKEPGGVTAIDTATLKVAAQIPTGAGHHEVVISSDNRFVFVSNRESGTVSTIDVRKLAKLDDIKIGAAPASLALSSLSKVIYVASETEGIVTAIDEQSQRILGRMKMKPGLRSIRFAPGGRYGFVLNTSENTVFIFDAATNRLLHEVKVGKAPDQIMFSNNFAYVRSLATENVAMIHLATIDADVEMNDFPGGQGLPNKASPPAQADAMVLAPEGNSVIVANPTDRVIYYYTEGMTAPMGDFQNYQREPRAVLVVDRSLRETNSGIYTANVKLPASGKYDVAFLTDSPRISHCFEAAAQPNPTLQKERQVALRLNYQVKEMRLSVGQDFSLRFKLVDAATNKPKDDLRDVRVLTFSGAWQRRDLAKSLGGGVYEINLNVPEPGGYTVFVESVSMGVRYRDLPYLMLEATDEKTAPTSEQSNAARKP